MTDGKNRPPKSPFSPVFVENGDKPPSPEPPRQAPDSQQQSSQNSGNKPRQTQHETKELRTARNFIMVGSIAGPVSLFIGGVLLSAVGLICSALGLRKLSILSKRNSDVSTLAANFKKSAITALSICGVAFILNVVSFIIMYPVILNAVENGDYGDLIPSMGGGSTSSGTSSTWG